MDSMIAKDLTATNFGEKITGRKKEISRDPESGTLFSLGCAKHLSRLILVPSAAKIRRLRCLALTYT